MSRRTYSNLAEERPTLDSGKVPFGAPNKESSFQIDHASKAAMVCSRVELVYRYAIVRLRGFSNAFIAIRARAGVFRPARPYDRVWSTLEGFFRTVHHFQLRRRIQM